MTTHDLPGCQTIYCGDVLDVLRTLPDESVQCCVTSPPYWGLRDYGTARWEGGDAECDHKCGNQVGDSNNPHAISRGTRPGTDMSHCSLCGAVRVDAALGNEPTPAEYVANMVAVFGEVRRVLRSDGCLWLNLGSSYARDSAKGDNSFYGKHADWCGDAVRIHDRDVPPGFKPKDLVGIPWMVAFALQADGWWLRSDVIWHKPGPMPESCTDRPTKAHEYIFMLTKSERYFFDQDAVREPAKYPGDDRGARTDKRRGSECNSVSGVTGDTRNIRTVWTINTHGYDGAHFATFPEAIPERCLKAGTSERGCCPECGKPWVRVVIRGNSGHHCRPGCGCKEREGQQQNWEPGWTGYGGFKSTAVDTGGWEPTCTCDAGDPVPCTILDPFAGSGTTLAVAKLLGLHGIGIELNPEYVKLATERIALAGYRTGADRREAATLLSSPTLFDEVPS